MEKVSITLMRSLSRLKVDFDTEDEALLFKRQIERGWPDGQHAWNCEKDVQRPCNCGLDRALALHAMYTDEGGEG